MEPLSGLRLHHIEALIGESTNSEFMARANFRPSFDPPAFATLGVMCFV